MSFNRENVIWQSKDGSWNIGFYKVLMGDTFDADYDPEWDVDYDFEQFEWASTGHLSKDQARLAWKGSNPGSHTTVPYKGNAAECKQLDRLVWALRNPIEAEKKRVRARAAQLRAVRNESVAALPTHILGTFVTVAFNDVKQNTARTEFYGQLIDQEGWFGLSGAKFVKIMTTDRKKFAPHLEKITVQPKSNGYNYWR